MAQRWPSRSVFSPLLHSRLHTAIQISFIAKSQLPTTLTSKNFSSVPVSVSISGSRLYCDPSLQCTASSSSSGNSIESDTHTSPSPTGVFIKGLPESVTEGRLKKAFSQFGEVVQVKIVIEKMLKQPLGSAFVWFTCTESANLAVEEMNGKFFDGRFILVKIAEPWLSKNRGRSRRYKF